MLIYRIASEFGAAKIDYAIAGGFAVALHGAVRGTVDVDIVLTFTKKNLELAETTLTKMGLVSRIPVTAKEIFQFRKEYIERRNLIAWNFYNPKDPLDVLDIIITEDLASRDVVRVRAGNRMLPVLSIPALIAMKRKSGRPQDLEDISALERLKL